MIVHVYVVLLVRVSGLEVPSVKIYIEYMPESATLLPDLYIIYNHVHTCTCTCMYMYIVFVHD